MQTLEKQKTNNEMSADQVALTIIKTHEVIGCVCNSLVMEHSILTKLTDVD